MSEPIREATTAALDAVDGIKAWQIAWQSSRDAGLARRVIVETALGVGSPIIAAAERTRIRAAAEGLQVKLLRPGNGPGQAATFTVVPWDTLAQLLDGNSDG